MVRRDERGAALIMATVFLFTVAAIVVAILFSAGQEFRNSSRAIQNLNSMMLSEAASHRMLGGLNTTRQVGNEIQPVGFDPGNLMDFAVRDGDQNYIVKLPYPRDQYTGNRILRFGDTAADAQLSGSSFSAGRYWGTFFPLYNSWDLPPQPYDVGNPMNPIYGMIRGTGDMTGEMRGVELYVRLLIQPPDVVTPFDMGLFGDLSLQMNGNSFSDSYNSQWGSYASQAVNANDPGDPANRPVANSNGDVGSNGSVTIAGNTWVYGDAVPGPNQPVLWVAPNAGVTGNTLPAQEETPLPSVEIPFPPQPLGAMIMPDALSVTGGGGLTLNSGTYVFPSVSINGNASSTGVTIPADADVTIYVTGDFGMGASGKLIIGDNANVKIIVVGTTTATGSTKIDNQGDLTWYGQGAMNFGGNATTGAPANTDAGIDIFTYSSLQAGGTSFVNNTGTPHNMSIWSLGDSAVSDQHYVQFMGNASYVGTVYAPDVPVKFGGSGNHATQSEVFGAIVGDTVQVVGNGLFHYDESLGLKPLPSIDPPQAVFSVIEWKEVGEATAAGNKDPNRVAESGYWPYYYYNMQYEMWPGGNPQEVPPAQN